VLGALALLYGAQGVPFGFAAEYLPVLLRTQGMSRTQIAALFWLQLPWQLKPLWAGVADHPRVRPWSRPLLLGLQLCLALTMAAYALFSGPGALGPWFALTALAALVAATQDIFVDAFAVRALSHDDRGYGNSAQIAGYRVGIIVGGGGMLVLSAALGTSVTVLCCAALIALAGAGAFVLRDDEARPSPPDVGAVSYASRRGSSSRPRRTGRRGSCRCCGMCLARCGGASRRWPSPSSSAPTRPRGSSSRCWSTRGGATRPSGPRWSPSARGRRCSGPLGGGALHRALGERRALGVAAVAQAVTALPLVAVVALGAPRGLTSAVIALEHGASGLGTTVLFAALMTATSRARAALHYTVLTSLNALAIGLGGLVGAAVGDLAGNRVAFLAAAALAAAPWCSCRGGSGPRRRARERTRRGRSSFDGLWGDCLLSRRGLRVSPTAGMHEAHGARCRVCVWPV
jgi:PAT family beta-lactamase induction signal transducer AmpG